MNKRDRKAKKEMGLFFLGKNGMKDKFEHVQELIRKSQ